MTDTGTLHPRSHLSPAHPLPNILPGEMKTSQKKKRKKKASISSEQLAKAIMLLPQDVCEFLPSSIHLGTRLKYANYISGSENDCYGAFNIKSMSAAGLKSQLKQNINRMQY